MKRWLLRGLGVAIVLLIALFVIVLTTNTQVEEGESRVVTAEQLTDLAEGSDQTIYWAGEVEGAEIELTRGTDGSFLVTYIPEDGEQQGPSTSIGTYPMQDPITAIGELAGAEGAIVRDSEHVGSVITNRASRSNVYFTDPAAGVQVEVFARDPAEAMELARSGAVTPVE